MTAAAAAAAAVLPLLLLCCFFLGTSFELAEYRKIGACLVIPEHILATRHEQRLPSTIHQLTQATSTVLRVFTATAIDRLSYPTAVTALLGAARVLFRG